MKIRLVTPELSANDVDGWDNRTHIRLILTLEKHSRVKCLRPRSANCRIVQLINKSTQFNLTTRRYSDREVCVPENDPNVFTLQVRRADIFGDNGMISVVICRPGETGVWESDMWLMSCRVLGRKVEQMVLREVLAHARAAGICRLAGVYRPTDRNKLVVDHFAMRGFAKVKEEEFGQTQWELLVEGAEPEITPMKAVSHGFVRPELSFR